MTSVVFSTPGLIPLESFQCFGLHAKPNSNNPLGFFGTGLKIAIAVILRHKQEIVLWRGKDKYTFYLKAATFRDREVEHVRMKKETWSVLNRIYLRPSYTQLPFTIDLGKTWELWQAYRELETNTRDENGETYTSNHSDGHIAKGIDNHTWIVVTGQKFVDEFHDRDRNFLPDGLSERSSSDRIQILDRPSKHIYYRGMRIMDLKKEAAFTYNFLQHVELTEDRTAKYPFILEANIAEAMQESEDTTFIEKTVPTTGYSGPDRWEHSISHSYASPRSRSTIFMDRAREAKSPLVKEIWDQHQPTVKTKTHLTLMIPKAGLTELEIAEIFAAVKSIHPSVKLTDDEGRTWQDAQIDRVYTEALDDDVPF